MKRELFFAANASTLLAFAVDLPDPFMEDDILTIDGCRYWLVDEVKDEDDQVAEWRFAPLDDSDVTRVSVYNSFEE